MSEKVLVFFDLFCINVGKTRMSKRLFSISNFNLNSSTFSVNNLLSYVPRAIPTKKKSLSKSQSGKRVVIETTDVASITNEVHQHSHYKRSTHPTSVPISKLFSNTFPLGVAESIEHYKLRNDPFNFNTTCCQLYHFIQIRIIEAGLRKC